jgi:hypothetical protein
MTNPLFKDTKSEAVVYFTHSPDRGPQHRVFDDNYIYNAGGIDSIELDLKRETYWYCRLGTIYGTPDARWQVTFRHEDFEKLPDQAVCTRQMGLLDPSRGLGELERQIFQSVFLALSDYVRTWAYTDKNDYIVNDYVIKNASITPAWLSVMGSALIATGKAHDMVEANVLKYSNDTRYPEKVPSGDVILNDFPVTLPVQVRWGDDSKVVVAQVLPVARCKGGNKSRAKSANQDHGTGGAT